MVAEVAEAVLEERREIPGGGIDMGFPAALQREQVGGGDGLRWVAIHQVEPRGAAAEADSRHAFPRRSGEIDLGVPAVESGGVRIELVAGDEIDGGGCVRESEDGERGAWIHAVLPRRGGEPTARGVLKNGLDIARAETDARDAHRLEIGVDFPAHGDGRCAQQAVEAAFAHLPDGQDTENGGGGGEKDGENERAQDFRFQMLNFKEKQPEASESPFES